MLTNSSESLSVIAVASQLYESFANFAICVLLTLGIASLASISSWYAYTTGLKKYFLCMFSE